MSTRLLLASVFQTFRLCERRKEMWAGEKKKQQRGGGVGGESEGTLSLPGSLSLSSFFFSRSLKFRPHDLNAWNRLALHKNHPRVVEVSVFLLWFVFLSKVTQLYTYTQLSIMQLYTRTMRDSMLACQIGPRLFSDYWSDYSCSFCSTKHLHQSWHEPCPYLNC